jgi:hypothetical protein
VGERPGARAVGGLTAVRMGDRVRLGTIADLVLGHEERRVLGLLVAVAGERSHRLGQRAEPEVDRRDGRRTALVLRRGGVLGSAAPS